MLHWVGSKHWPNTYAWEMIHILDKYEGIKTEAIKQVLVGTVILISVLLCGMPLKAIFYHVIIKQNIIKSDNGTRFICTFIKLVDMIGNKRGASWAEFWDDLGYNADSCKRSDITDVAKELRRYRWIFKKLQNVRQSVARRIAR